MTSPFERDLPASPNEGEAEEVDEHVNGHASEGAFVDEPDGQVDLAVDEILTDVIALTAERDEYLGALQRTQADFANFRKRVLRQQEEQSTRAAFDLVTKILPVLDTLDLAVAHLDTQGDGEPSTEAQALRQARSQLIDILHKEGLERVDQVAVPFDPSVHDAVAHAPADDGDDSDPGSKIEEVMRSGYRWRGQTMRPAMVRVRG
jgi:molecular chaperone GrpE